MMGPDKQDRLCDLLRIGPAALNGRPYIVCTALDLTEKGGVRSAFGWIAFVSMWD